MLNQTTTDDLSLFDGFLILYFWTKLNVLGLVGNPPYKEKFVLMDDEKRVKGVEIVEGGYLDLGFTFYGFKFEVIEKDENSSFIKLTIDFETKDVENVHLTIANLQAFIAIMKTSADYLEK